MSTTTLAPTNTSTLGFGCVTDADCGFVACTGDRGLDSATCVGAMVSPRQDGVCTCATRARFFIGIGIYIAVLLAIAVYARMETKRSLLPKADRLRDHFMASSSFGTFVMVLSLFSTAFSGYTVVGVPEEASRLGYPAMRWLTIGVFVNIGALVIYPRLRQVGLARRYNSPTDLVGDRFNCNSLRLLTSLALVIPLFIYTTVQFIALADIIEGLSLGRIQRQTAASMLCGVIIVCEVMGGQRSVTISDTVQASIMMAAFLVMPFVLVYFYGGLPDIVEPNCPRSHRLADGTFAGCVAYNRPWIIQTPTVTSSCDIQNNLTDTSCYAGFNESAYQPPINPNTDPDFQHVALSMLMFNLNGMAFGLNPHFLQKVFAAKSDLVLKRSLMLLTVAALVTNLPSLYYGFVRVAAMPDAEGSAFSVVTGKMIDRGGFSEIVAVIASCSALAAIMSTADSAIIGANNLLTVEWVKNFLWRGASPQQIEYVSKGFTVGFAICALIFSFNVDKIPFAALFNLQNSFVWQPAPTFFAALYSDRVAAHPLLYGQIMGLIVCLTIATRDGGEFVVPSGFIGLAVNVSVVALTQLGLSATGSLFASDDTRRYDLMDTGVVSQYGSCRLTADYVGRHIMKGTDEPLMRRRNQGLVLLAILLIILGHPWYAKPYTDQSVSSGVTQWAVVYFVCYMFAVALITYVYSTWGCSEMGSKAEPTRTPEASVSRRPSAAPSDSCANGGAATPLVSDDEAESY